MTDDSVEQVDRGVRTNAGHQLGKTAKFLESHISSTPLERRGYPGQEHTDSLGLGKKWLYLGAGREWQAGDGVRLPVWPVCLKTLA